MVRDNVSFYPVVQLLTGPPGLVRNGGVWKLVKRDLSKVMKPANIMVQALHMKNYSLSEKSWELWNETKDGKTVLAGEIEKTFGSNRSVFVDSGGFQLMYQDKIDLSKWNLELSPESIFDLQCKFAPDKVASLDYPITPKTVKNEVNRCARQSVKNIEYLLDNYQSYDKIPVPYLVVHGRTPEEIGKYLKRIDEVLKTRKPDNFGIALGSQVPLTASPLSIVSNVEAVLQWMEKKKFDVSVPLHMFGIGESVIGKIDDINQAGRTLSFDNSTSVQRGYMQKIYDPISKKYVRFDIRKPVKCSCAACKALKKLGTENIANVLSSKSYKKDDSQTFTRSDIFALITLHNISHWKDRADNNPTRSTKKEIPINTEFKVETEYEFPLRSFKNNSAVLIMMACSKTRPYRDSSSHKKVIKTLSEEGYEESKDYDRITLSGLFGPVFWNDENDVRILSYDFQLCEGVSEEHRNDLRIRTANVLNTIGKRYEKIVAYLPAKQYRETFEPTLEKFEAVLVDNYNKLPSAFES